MIEIFKTNAEGRLDALPEEMLSAEGFSPKDCWINLVNPSDKEVATISALVGVEEDVLKTPLDDEERSRYENEDDYSLVLVDIPVIEEEAAYYSYFTIPLGAVIKDDCMITVCLKDTAVMRDFARGRIRNFATFKKTRFLFQILYNLASKYLAYLKQIDKASQRIQNELHKSTRNKELIRMLDLENSLVYFSTSLTGNDAVITRLLSGKNLGHHDQDVRRGQRPSRRRRRRDQAGDGDVLDLPRHFVGGRWTPTLRSSPTISTSS